MYIQEHRHPLLEVQTPPKCNTRLVSPSTAAGQLRMTQGLEGACHTPPAARQRQEAETMPEPGKDRSFNSPVAAKDAAAGLYRPL